LLRIVDLLLAQGQFGRGAGEVAFDDVRVRKVDDRGLEPAFENERRVAQQVLVERVRITDEHDQRILQLAPGPAGLLPEGGE